MPTLFFLGQIVLGVYFIMAGTRHFTNLAGMTGYAASRKLPMPRFSVIVSGLALWLSGLGVLFQYNLVLAYGLLIAFLVLSAFLVHAFWIDQDPNVKMGNQVNFQKNLALASALMMLLALV